MRILSLVALGLLSCAAVTTAQAVEVTFSGTITSACTILASTNGVLGINANGDAFSSSSGAPGTVTMLSIGLNKIDVAAPTLVTFGSGYSNTDQVLEVSYSGVNGLSAVSQNYTPSATSVNIGNLAASVLTVNNRITNSHGFAPGNYSTSTLVTCSPRTP